MRECERERERDRERERERERARERQRLSAFKASNSSGEGTDCGGPMLVPVAAGGCWLKEKRAAWP